MAAHNGVFQSLSGTFGVLSFEFWVLGGAEPVTMPYLDFSARDKKERFLAR